MATRARWWGPILVFALALGLLAGCGDDDDAGGGGAAGGEEEATTTTALQGPGDPVSPAATFRTDLTALLHEHVYLVGLAAVDGSADAGDALDQNTRDVSDMIASAFGTGVGDQFAELWGAHADDLVAGGNPTDFPAQMQELMAEHLGEDAAGEVATELEDHVQTAAAAVGAVTGGGGGAEALRTAADSMTALGTTLSVILVEDLVLEGEAEVPAVELRVELADLLAEHVFLVGLAATGAPGLADAQAALDANTQALADVVTEVYDADGGTEFARIWGAHADLLLGFAAGQVVEAQVESGLDAFRDELGELVEELTAQELTAEALAEELVPHADTVVPAIQAVQAGEDGGVTLRDAAAVMASTAETLAGAFTSALESA